MQSWLYYLHKLILMEGRAMNKFPTLALSLALLLGGIGIMTQATANPSKHGYGGGMGMGMMMGKSWMMTLSDEQQQKVNKLRLDYKKKTYLLKAQMKQTKIELALLITSDSPKKADINKKIDRIISLKGQKLRLKVDHKMAVRKVLNDEQRVTFDLHVMKKAAHGKRRGYRH